MLAEATYTLSDVCARFPNHLVREALDIYISQQWSAVKIFKALPLRCQETRTQQGIRRKAEFLNKRIDDRKREMGLGGTSGEAVKEGGSAKRSAAEAGFGEE